MIHAFEIKYDERKLFFQFALDRGLTTPFDFKFRPSNSVYRVIKMRDWKTKEYYMEKEMNALVLFHDRLTCEVTEFTWHILKDEMKRNSVAMAA